MMINALRLNVPPATALTKHCCAMLVVLAATLGAARAQSAATRADEPDDPAATLSQESAGPLPATPNRRTLLPFDVSAIATQSFALAPESLAVGSDGVIRFTVVARSQSGAENISYEGLRCTTLESIRYASGHADGTWSSARNLAWEPIRGGIANRYQAALADGFLCDGHTIAGNAASMLRSLKNRAPINPRSEQ